jgi:ParB/RepB/Spo0J family partition protein
MITLKIPPLEACLIRVESIRANPLNPRKHFDIEALGPSLAAGQVESIWVRPHPTESGAFELVDGERRWRAAQAKGIEELEALLGDFDDGQVLRVALTKGAQNQSLSAIEEAIGFADLMKRENLTQEDLATQLGVDRRTVGRWLMLLGLPQAARDAVARGDLPPRAAYEIARVPSEAMRAELAALVLAPGEGGELMAYRKIAALVASKYCRTLKKAPFDLSDATLPGGACDACQWKAGNNPALFGDVSNGETCMHLECFTAKLAALRLRDQEKAIAAGKKVLTDEENALAFPSEDRGLSYRSDFVPIDDAPPEDLIRPEVTKAPAWRKICGDRAQVYVGYDQAGDPVELVRLKEAITAASPQDAAIFNDQTARRYLLPVDASAPASAPREKPDVALREERKRRAIKDAKGQEWLRHLREELRAVQFGDFILLTLRFERTLVRLTEEDAEFITGAFPEVRATRTEHKTALAAIKEHAAECDRPGLGSLEACLALAPELRASGDDAAWALEWQKAFLDKEPAKTEAAEEPAADLPPPDDCGETQVLRAALEIVWKEVGIFTPAVQDQFAEFCLGKPLPAPLAPKDLRKIIASLQKHTKATAAPIADEEDGDS